MPLDPSAIVSGLPGANGADYPATTAECAQAWAQAIGTAFAAVVPPSTTVAAAQATLATALLAAFTAGGDVGTAMDAALTAFAATVGLGMAPAYVAVPPPAPCGLSTVFAANLAGRRSRDGCIQAVAAAIDTWARTGTATLAVLPFTPTTWT